MSKSIGIWVCIKVRILTESPWKWIRLSQSFSVITDRFLLGTVLHISVVLHVSCAALPCRSSILCLSLFVPTPFPFQDNNEMLKTLCLSSLKTFRERWSTLEYLKKNFSLPEPFTIILYLRCPDLYCGYQKLILLRQEWVRHL